MPRDKYDSWHEFEGDYTAHADPGRHAANQLRERCYMCGTHVHIGEGCHVTTRTGGPAVVHRGACCEELAELRRIQDEQSGGTRGV